MQTEKSIDFLHETKGTSTHVQRDLKERRNNARCLCGNVGATSVWSCVTKGWAASGHYPASSSQRGRGVSSLLTLVPL